MRKKIESARSKEEKELLQKIQESRAKLEGYIVEVEELNEHVQSIFPKNLKDFRQKFLIDDKLKTTTSFYSTLLNLNQEVCKTLFLELEYRRKKKRFESGEEDINIRELADRIYRKLEEDTQKKIEQFKDKIEPLKKMVKGS